MMDDDLKMAILVEIAKHFPYSYGEVRVAYEYLQSFDRTIKAAEIARRNNVPLRAISHAPDDNLTRVEFDHLLDGLGIDHIEDLWE